MKRFAIIVAVGGMLAAGLEAASVRMSDGERIELARDRKALLPVVIASDASAEVEELAETLAKGLNRISGASFEVRRGGSQEGIRMGTAEEWPGVLPEGTGDLSPVLAREVYLLKSHGEGLWIVGRTPLALQNAVWDLLYRFGFRQFYPGAHWEIWPSEESLSISIHTLESPDFHTRRLFIGGGVWPSRREEFKEWEQRNRMVSGFTLNTGHVYNQIIGRHPVVFKEHPEYIANPGEAQEKLDPSHPEVLEIVLQDALSQLRNNPDQDSVSVDPSDGGGWRSDSPLGRVSNQVVTIANHVAKGIQKEFPGRKVGMYAYNEHSPAPDIAVDPNVIVSVATSFLRGGHTPDELISAWRAKGAEIGLREYLSVFSWDKDMPGRSRAADPDYLFTTIPHYYNLGVRYWITEGSSGWAAHGLGYYLASRLLWDVKSVERRDELMEDFIVRSFGEAADGMREFYRMTLKEGRPLLSEDLIGRMYRLLDEALKKTDSREIRQRILDLVAYTHYVDLEFTYRNSDGKERVAAFEKLAAFCYAQRHHSIFNTLASIRNTPKRDKQLTPVLVEGATGIPQFDDLPEPDLMAILKHGVESRKLNDFTPVAFSENLIPYPAGAEASQIQERNPVSVRVRGDSRLYLFAESPGRDFFFEVRGGMIYQRLGPVTFRLYSPQHAIVGEPISTAEVPADKEWHQVKLTSPYGGLHFLEVSDSRGATDLNWPAGQRVTFPASPEDANPLVVSPKWVFYVPGNSRVLGFYTDALFGQIVSGDGKAIHHLRKLAAPGTHSVAVEESQSGTIWTLEKLRGMPLLMTVPPYVARTVNELLVPEEALKKASE